MLQKEKKKTLNSALAWKLICSTRRMYQCVKVRQGQEMLRCYKNAWGAIVMPPCNLTVTQQLLQSHTPATGFLLYAIQSASEKMFLIQTQRPFLLSGLSSCQHTTAHACPNQCCPLTHRRREDKLAPLLPLLSHTHTHRNTEIVIVPAIRLSPWQGRQTGNDSMSILQNPNNC